LYFQVRLALAGALHTSFMQPAVSRLEPALAATEIRTPRIPVISNVDAQPHSDPDTIKLQADFSAAGELYAKLEFLLQANRLATSWVK
jgi:acyl transferase domain-containing protein